jgi:hypothetical protein
MTILKTLAATAAMTLLLGTPVVLGGCSSKPDTIEEACEDIGKACNAPESEIQECKDGNAQAASIAAKVGCGDKFDAMVTCGLDNYETPTEAQCNDEEDDTLPASCSAQFNDYFSCVTAACTADPSKCQ